MGKFYERVGRLTTREGSEEPREIGNRLDIIEKLADYEDTGLTPAQVKEMMVDWIVYKQAMAEGRMIIQPRNSSRSW